MSRLGTQNWRFTDIQTALIMKTVFPACKVVLHKFLHLHLNVNSNVLLKLYPPMQ